MNLRCAAAQRRRQGEPMADFIRQKPGFQERFACKTEEHTDSFTLSIVKG